MQLVNLIDDYLQAVILEARQERVEANRLIADGGHLPVVEVPDVRYRSGRVQRFDQTIAARPFDAPSLPIAMPKADKLDGDLPKWMPRVDITEQDIVLAQRLAGQQVNILPTVARAAREVARTVLNTYESLAAGLLSTGNLTVIIAGGPGTPDVSMTLDFGVPAANKFVPATKWDQTGATILADLRAWVQQFTDQGGDPQAAVIRTSSRVISLMLLNEQVRSSLGTSNAVTQAGLTAALQAHGLPPIVAYDRVLRNAAGVRQRIWPADRLAIIPTGDPIGSTQVGITAEAILQVENRILTAEQAPGLTINTLGQDDPPSRAVKGAAAGLPVLDEPDVLVVASGLLT